MQFATGDRVTNTTATGRVTRVDTTAARLIVVDDAGGVHNIPIDSTVELIHHNPRWIAEQCFEHIRYAKGLEPDDRAIAYGIIAEALAASICHEQVCYFLDGMSYFSNDGELVRNITATARKQRQEKAK